MVGQNREDFQVPTGRLADEVEGKGDSPCFGERESHQPREISGRVTIGLFPNWGWGSR